MTPKCPKCDGNTFLDIPYSLPDKEALLVYCSNCGAVIGVLPQ